jgi:hypothetical protein
MPKDVSKYCAGLTKAGNPCRAAATEGGLCFFHANPNKASELGRIGGRKKIKPEIKNTVALAAVETANDIKNMVAQLILGVSTGKVNPRTAAGLVPLLGLQLRTIDVADHDARLRKLEEGALYHQQDRRTR